MRDIFVNDVWHTIGDIFLLLAFGTALLARIYQRPCGSFPAKDALYYLFKIIFVICVFAGAFPFFIGKS
jgi:Na+/alanine symporter